MNNTRCPFHQDIEHTVERLEARMTRLEIGIVTLFGAIIVMLGSTLWTMMDLPGALQQERDNTQHILQMLNENQEQILEQLRGR